MTYCFPTIPLVAALYKFHCRKKHIEINPNSNFFYEKRNNWQNLLWKMKEKVFCVDEKPTYLNALVVRNELRSCNAALAFFTLCFICSNVDWWNRYVAQSDEHCAIPNPSSDFIWVKWAIFFNHVLFLKKSNSLYWLSFIIQFGNICVRKKSKRKIQT